MLVECPNCSRRLSTADDTSRKMARRRVKCPACGVTFVPRALPEQQSSTAERTCPACGAGLDTDAVICISCGLNLKTGTQVGLPRLPTEVGGPTRTWSDKGGYDWGGTLGNLFGAARKFSYILIPFLVIAVLIGFGRNLRDKHAFVTELAEPRVLEEHEVPQLLSGLAERVAEGAREHSIEILEDEDRDWKLEVKLVDRERDFSSQGFRGIVLKYEVPVRQRLLGQVPLSRKAVQVSQLLSVRKDSTLLKVVGSPLVWRTPTMASLELSGEETGLCLPGLTISVPAGAAPEGTKLIVRYPYEPPREVQRGRNVLACVKLETQPHTSFAEPVTLQFSTTHLSRPAGGYNTRVLSDEAGRWLAVLAQAQFTRGRMPPTTLEEVRRDPDRIEEFLEPVVIPLQSLRQFAFGPEMAEGVKLNLVGMCFTCDQGQGEALFADRDAVRVVPLTKSGDFGEVPGPIDVHYPVTHTGTFTVWYQTTKFGLQKGSANARMVADFLRQFNKNGQGMLVIRCSIPPAAETLNAFQNLFPHQPGPKKL